MPFEGDPFAFYGKLIIEHHHDSLLKKLPTPKLERGGPDPLELSDEDHRFLPQLKVGILGAGVGGLYTALMLDSLGIDYEVLEASDRAGGRLSTYHFAGGQKYDYFEEGAMRFPLPKKDASGAYNNGTMRRLAELIEYPKLNEGSGNLKDTLIPYYYSARDPSHPGFYYFNGVFQNVPSKGSQEKKGSFDAEDMGVDAVYAKTGTDAIQGDVYNPFIRMLINDMEKGTKDGWAVLKANDAYSVRGYMASKYIPSYSLDLPPKHLSNNVINWCNLLEDGSGRYDNGLSEAVFEAMAFANVGDSSYGDVDWRCFEGGTETLSKKMEAYINSTGVYVNFNKRVTAIGQGYMAVSLPHKIIHKHANGLPSTVRESHSDSAEVVLGEEENESGSRKILEIPCVTVTVDGCRKKHYGHVISTLPVSVLRAIDLNDAGLNVMQRNAVRALNYGPSIKIGVLFKSNWWTTRLGIIGGQSFTDLPIRTIVYPSYGVDSDTPSKVIIASYTWTTDAYRLGALALKKEKEVLKELVLRNLAEAHRHRDPGITYEYLCGEYVDLHVKDWSNDQHAMGAFAEFLPGQFENLYTSLNVPAADSRLHFAGEAISTRHAWVVGALDSAWKAVYEYLKVTGQTTKIEKFKEIWGGNVEWTSGSTLLENGPDHDLLDQHIGLVRKAVLAGLF